MSAGWQHVQRESDHTRRVPVVRTHAAGVAHRGNSKPLTINWSGVIDDELHNSRDADRRGHVRVDHLDAGRHVLHGERTLDAVTESCAVGDPQCDGRTPALETRHHERVAATAAAKIAETPRVLGDVPIGVPGPLEELHGVALSDDTVGARLDDEVGHGSCAACTRGQDRSWSTSRCRRSHSEADGTTVGPGAGRQGNVVRVVHGIVAQIDAVDERIDRRLPVPRSADDRSADLAAPGARCESTVRRRAQTGGAVRISLMLYRTGRGEAEGNQRTRNAEDARIGGSARLCFVGH